MYVANAKCLLQGAGNAVLDARVDPLTGKYIVTQSDTQDIFDGLAIETERTIATGGTTFEHGLLWGDAVAEINDANLFASTPATDQRQVNEMVRSMAVDLPAGVDLSKAKAWAAIAPGGNIRASFNVESVAYTATGINDVVFAVPFKSANYVVSGGAEDGSYVSFDTGNKTATQCRATVRTDAASASNQSLFVAFFGELENE
jgi:hypothetical protein